ncbi:hypothetical protein D6C00_13550 [Thiohalobacter thiocyanaticus]|uniref:Uncharacterized protein n=1 Tax=Thiohalobacter thiocyanaticus TaxID=585455 RepID=A0A426QM65_9GAMM|nr:hypothetical protein D6C00_13550 [Thiohalobacter thiocyanaticus]
MATEKDIENKENQIVESDSGVVAGIESRRRLLKGAALTPVLLSLTSRPVLGAECTISGFMSGNVSDHGHDDCACGFTPGAWKTPYVGDGNWNHTPFDPGTCKNQGQGQCNNYNGDGTPFFGPSTFSGSDPHYAGKTLMQVLWLSGNQDPHQFGAHIVAALLNAYAIPGYGMSPADVQAIYANVDANGGAAGGYYMGNNGKMLTVEQVVAFIQSTLCAYQ